MSLVHFQWGIADNSCVRVCVGGGGGGGGGKGGRKGGREGGREGDQIRLFTSEAQTNQEAHEL